MVRRASRVLAGAVVAVALVPLAFPSAAGAVFAGKPGRLVFDQRQGSRNFLWDYAPRTGRLRQLTRAPSGCRGFWDDSSAEYAPDGRRIAYLHRDGCGGDRRYELWLARADGSSARRLAPLPADLDWDFGRRVAFSADGRRIAVSLDDNVDIERAHVHFDAKTGALLARHDWNANDVDNSIDWSTRGSRVVGGLHVSRLLRGGGLQQLSFPPRGGEISVSHDREPGWSPSGDSIAFVRFVQRGLDESSAHRAQATVRYTLWSISTSRSRRPRRLARSSEGFFSPVFAPDGQALAFITWRGEIRLVPSRGGQARVLLKRESIGFTLDWQPLPRKDE